MKECKANRFVESQIIYLCFNISGHTQVFISTCTLYILTDVYCVSCAVYSVYVTLYLSVNSVQ